MQSFTINPANNTITSGIISKAYTVEGHKLTGVDVGIFNRPNSNTLKIFNIYGSGDDQVINNITPIFKAVRYHPDRKYLSAAKVETDEALAVTDMAIIYFNADNPATRANLFNTEELYNKGVFYAGRKLDTETRTNRFGKEYVYESLPAILIATKDIEYKYATFIDNKKHIVTFKYDGSALVIIKDDVIERKPREQHRVHNNVMSDALMSAIKESGDMSMLLPDNKNTRKRKSKNKWEVNRKEARWN